MYKMGSQVLLQEKHTFSCALYREYYAMFSIQQKAQCVSWYVHRTFVSNCSLNVSEFLIMLINNVNQHIFPSRKVTKTWYEMFRTDNSTCDSSRLPPPDADRERVRLAFHNSPTLSVRQHLCPQH
jgi:hypothetical protein